MLGLEDEMDWRNSVLASCAAGFPISSGQSPTQPRFATVAVHGRGRSIRVRCKLLVSVWAAVAALLRCTATVRSTHGFSRRPECREISRGHVARVLDAVRIFAS
jgi:hypothetical protein